jgi:catechol-2,3-dioxygenase
MAGSEQTGFIATLYHSRLTKGGSMPKVTSLGHVGIYVRDVERSKAFYRDILGLGVSDSSPERGHVFMTAQDRDKEHHELLLMPGREDGKVIQQISFRCSSIADLKEFYRALLQRSVPIVRTVSHGNAVGVYFLDPDGNQVEIYWPTGIDWPQPFGKPVDLNASDEQILANLT